MEIAVWDTYVERLDGKLMHFDVLVKTEVDNAQEVIGFGKKYLSTKGFKTGKITAKECRFCHVEKASITIENAIIANGFAILEMEHCS